MWMTSINCKLESAVEPYKQGRAGPSAVAILCRSRMSGSVSPGYQRSASYVNHAMTDYASIAKHGMILFE